MKINLDFDKKIIVLQKDVLLHEFVDKVRLILPNFYKWTLKLLSDESFKGGYIYIGHPYRVVPWWDNQPLITKDEFISFDEIEGQYNIEIK